MKKVYYKMLRLISLVFIFLCFAGTASAKAYDELKWKELIEFVVSIEYEYGEFCLQNCSPDELVHIVNLMVDTGLSVDDDLVGEMRSLDKTTEKQKRCAIRILEDHYEKPISEMTHTSMLWKDYGPFDTLPAETKAWYSKMLAKYVEDPFSDNMTTYRSPSESAISEEKAVSIAYRILEQIFAVNQEDLQDWNYFTSFSFDGDRIEQSRWLICFYQGDGSDFMGAYMVTLSDDGILLSASSPLEPPSVEKEFRFAESDRKLLFYQWPYEEKAATSAYWRQQVDAYLKDHPDYRGYAYYATRQVYGIPTDDAISREQATETAAQAIRQQFSVPKKYVDSVNKYYAYDITNQHKPLWKIFFTPSEEDAHLLNISLGYIVFVHALDNEIVSIEEYTAESLPINIL